VGAFIKNRLIPNSTPLRHKLDASLSRRPLIIENRTVEEATIKKLLEEDAGEIVNNQNTELKGFMKSNSFAQFGGDIEDFISDVEKRSKLDFLMAGYVGKAFNHLESPYLNIDLSSLAFMNRLNTFAVKVEMLTGKPAKVVIATENGLFDKYVLGTNIDKSLNMVVQAKRIIKRFGFEKIEFKPFSSLLPKNFEKIVDKELQKLSDEKLTKRSEEINDVSKVLFLSFPTKSFRQAIKLYTDKKELKKIDQWTFRASLGYLAFTRARHNCGFWEKYRNKYIESSVSPKSNIVNFRYHVGRVTPPHGVAVIQQGSIITERFYDLVKSCQTHKKRPVLYRFNNIPFFFQGPC